MLMTFAETGFEIICNGNTDGFDSVHIDSRNVEPFSLFVALDGENVDGHQFVKNAFDAGACGAIVEKHKINDYKLKELATTKKCTLLGTDNSLHALQSMAESYLQKFDSLLKIGITGSAGKTTVKEITASIFSAEYGSENVVCNEGNLNSETGLPLSVFKVRAPHKVGIFEMGMNRHNEIAELAKVLKPDIACITNTGSAHIGLIGSTEKIALEKKDIFSEFNGNQTAIIPSDGEFTELLSKNINGKINYFSIAEFEKCGGKKNSKGLNGSEIFFDGKKSNFPLPGDHNFKNALAAMAIAKAANVSTDSIMKGLSVIRSLFGRCEIINGEITLVRDCYNSNPQSLCEAVSLCDSVQWDGKKNYVIGSMFELGSISKIEHKKAGLMLENSSCDFVYLFGDETLETKAAIKNKKCFWTNDIEELKGELKKNVHKGDFVLLKGSRGCALERVSFSELQN
ncbi:MAG: UDP-N-acetylmuramoyl-tripeptide--D-alanyl-D-alanine ligase [Termitinemataceae bacterium]|nr:MAG: UDP-N-acetylmuramoyl-tripeptide--D-alanyl-D-alanine ligase [Termitinemataceae bacterium]